MNKKNVFMEQWSQEGVDDRDMSDQVWQTS